MSIFTTLSNLIETNNYAEFSKKLSSVIKINNQLAEHNLLLLQRETIVKLAKKAAIADDVRFLKTMLWVHTFTEPELQEILKSAVEEKRHLAIMQLLLLNDIKLVEPLAVTEQMTAAKIADYQARVHLTQLIKLIKASSGFFRSIVPTSIQPMQEVLVKVVDTMPEVLGQFIDNLMDAKLINTFTFNEWTVFRSLVESLDLRYAKYINKKFPEFMYAEHIAEPALERFNYPSDAKPYGEKWEKFFDKYFESTIHRIFTILLAEDSDIKPSVNINAYMYYEFYEQTPLQIAVKVNNLKLVELFLKFPDVDVNRNYPLSLLQHATKHSDSKILQRLLAVPGINLNDEGHDAIYSAVESDNSKAITLLMKAGATSKNALHRALHFGCCDCVNALLAEMNLDEIDIGTVLYSENHGYLKESMVRWFIERMILLKTKEPKLKEKATLLLFHKHFPFEVNKKYGSDWTLLHRFCNYGEYVFLEELLMIPGLDLNVRNNLGRSPITYALTDSDSKKALRLLQIPEIEFHGNAYFKAHKISDKYELLEKVFAHPKFDINQMFFYGGSNAHILIELLYGSLFKQAHWILDNRPELRIDQFTLCKLLNWHRLKNHLDLFIKVVNLSRVDLNNPGFYPPLLTLINNNQVPFVAYLLTLPTVSTNITLATNKTPLQLATKQNNNEMVALLQKVRVRNYSELLPLLLDRSFMQKVTSRNLEQYVIFCQGFNDKNIIGAVRRFIDFYLSIESSYLFFGTPENALADVVKLDPVLFGNYIASLKAQPEKHPFANRFIPQFEKLIKKVTGQDLALPLVEETKVGVSTAVCATPKRQTIGDLYRAEALKASSSSSSAVTSEQAVMMGQMASARTEKLVESRQEQNVFGLDGKKSEQLDTKFEL